MNNQYYNPNRNSYKSSSTNTSINPKVSPKFIIFVGIIFLIAGVILTAIQFNDRQHYKALINEGISTSAYVTDSDKKITTSKSRRRNGTSKRRRTTKTYYSVTATYTVDDQSYPITFRSNSDYAEGDAVTIFYEEGNPANSAKEGEYVASPTSGFMIIFAGIGSIIIGFSKLREEKK